jgi:hypothetical protein
MLPLARKENHFSSSVREVLSMGSGVTGGSVEVDYGPTGGYWSSTLYHALVLPSSSLC